MFSRIRSSFVSGMCACLFVTAATAAEPTVVDFEALPLAPDSAWAGSVDLPGGVQLSNSYTVAEWGWFWSGFAVSSVTDNLSAGFDNQFASIVGSGAGGSNNYAVGYPAPAEITLAEPAVVEGLFVTNTAYAYWSMALGDPFAKKFGGPDGSEPDYLRLTASGSLRGAAVGAVEFLLADFSAADPADDYIVDDWRWMDLRALGEVDTVAFSLDSSDMGDWGMNTPGYFAIDDITIVPDPATAALLGAGAWGLFLRRRT